jgi:hypothetical protein
MTTGVLTLAPEFCEELCWTAEYFICILSEDLSKGEALREQLVEPA